MPTPSAFGATTGGLPLRKNKGDWIAHFVEMPNISAFANNPKAALDELKIAWEMVKEDYRASGEDIPVSPTKRQYSVSINS